LNSKDNIYTSNILILEIYLEFGAWNLEYILAGVRGNLPESPLFVLQQDNSDTANPVMQLSGPVPCFSPGDVPDYASSNPKQIIRL
jgi:hypothetical protein